METFKNIKVLIAEDNEINKLLAKRILDHWGLSYKTAHNGNEAVEMVMAEPFDLILMDINMPEKNGIDATKAIRALPDTQKNKIPIIALTANGLKGEEEKYIDAGMNGFLVKPFNIKELETILKNVMLKKTNFGNKFTDMTTKSSEKKYYDLSIISDLAQGNNEFIKNLAQIFLDTVPNDATLMLQYAANNNWTEVGKLAHKLKSTIDTMQIVSLKDDIRTLEHNGKKSIETDIVLPLSQKVFDILNVVSYQLKQEFNL